MGMIDNELKAKGFERTEKNGDLTLHCCRRDRVRKQPACGNTNPADLQRGTGGRECHDGLLATFLPSSVGSWRKERSSSSSLIEAKTRVI
jgi:hypothetical protein